MGRLEESIGGKGMERRGAVVIAGGLKSGNKIVNVSQGLKSQLHTSSSRGACKKRGERRRDNQFKLRCMKEDSVYLQQLNQVKAVDL